jgi:glycosyltransferase involved in cell wall biosynthesis
MQVEMVARNATPLFSIVIPAYNAANYIAEALMSVLGQTTDDYEIIVVNDGSPDTAQLEKALQPYLADLIYIKRPNGGPGAARNTGIRAARGEYIAFLDSDDEWVPMHLAQMRETLRADPTLDLMYGDAVNFGDVAEEGATTMETNPSERRVTFENLVLCKCTVVGSTVVARRKALIEAGLFDEDLAQAEDFELWARLAYRGRRIDYTRNITARRRIHKGNLTGDAIGSYGGQATALRKLLKELDLPDGLRNEMQMEVEKCEAAVALEKSKQQLVARRYEEAIVELRRANESYHSRKLQLVSYLIRTTPRLARHLYLRQKTKGSRSRTRVLLRSVGL